MNGSLRRLGSAALRSALAGGAYAWVGYLSTVGVYGNRDGQEVDEATAPAPTSERGRRRVAAEAAWADGALALPLAVFRLPAIYGPGRGPLAKARSGKARRVYKEGQLFSRVHVDDICNALLCSVRRPRAGAIYNVVDDAPAPAHEVVAHAFGVLGSHSAPQNVAAAACCGRC